MKRQLSLGAAALALSCATPDTEFYDLTQSIVGGAPVTNPDPFPSVGLLRFCNDANCNGFGICTGTLIDPATGDPADDGKWVLTAAHCIAPPEGSPSQAQFTTFRLGFTPEFGSADAVFQAKNLFRPAAYNPQRFFDGHDIALVELETPVTGIPMIPFHAVDPTPFDGQKFVAVGYGDTDGGAGDAGTKRFTAPSPFPNSGGGITIDGFAPQHVLYGSGGGTPNTCQGDSGGPAFIDIDVNGVIDENDTIIGVTSGGAGGCRGSSFNQRTDSQVGFISGVIDGTIQPEVPHCIDDGIKECNLCGISDPDCACSTDGFCQAAALCPDGIDVDPDCPELTEICDNGLDEDGNGFVDDGCKGCTVATPGSGATNTSLLFIASLFSLSLIVLARRSRRS